MLANVRPLTGRIGIFFYPALYVPPNLDVTFQLIASAIRIALADMDYIEGLVGLPLADMVTDNLKMLAECTYHVLCSTSYGENFLN